MTPATDQTTDQTTDLPANALRLPHPARLILWLVIGFALAAVGMVALPDQPYIRFQTLSQTIHNRVQWSYERIHFDPTPIDVAVIGNSRMEAGINAPALSAALSARLGRRVNVVNLSTPQEGRNMHWVMARELIAAHPEVSLILLSVIEQEPRVSHPAFRFLASRGDILAAPLLLNRDWLTDLAALPYRQLSLFVQGAIPGFFGLSSSFDSARYSGPDDDTTLTFTLPDGRIIDRDTVPPEPALRRAAEDRIRSIPPPLLPQALADYEFAVERTYTRRIAALAAATDVTVGFVYLPIYTNDAPIHDRDFYAGFGPVFEARQLTDAAALFSDYGHLNRVGALALVPWLADALTAEIAAGRIVLKPLRD